MIFRFNFNVCCCFFSPESLCTLSLFELSLFLRAAQIKYQNYIFAVNFFALALLKPTLPLRLILLSLAVADVFIVVDHLFGILIERNCNALHCRF